MSGDSDQFDQGYKMLADWRADFDTFSSFFLRKVQSICNDVGYQLDPDRDSLRIAHKAWAAACDRWKKERVNENSGDLSHIKVLSLLLYHLVSVDWAPTLFDRIPRDSGRWANKEELRDQIRGCINAGRGNYLGFQFVIQLINWFEEARVDRNEPFSFRLTPDLEHDLMVYFGSQKHDELSTYLILKALYSRPGENGN
ncbi:hypothetical protein AB7714_10715 [Tardiphaga sp. 1201_B9_N1_1]|uniref:hypothetical protein n=1 Tax=unclassified Tardiphaga TaxID=2631404 RepID=UPI003F1E7CA0